MQYKQLIRAINQELLYTEDKINHWKSAKESSTMMKIMIKKIVLKMLLNEDSIYLCYKFKIKLNNYQIWL